jgi:hypothetical protein
MALTWALAASDISPFPSLAGIVDLALSVRCVPGVSPPTPIAIFLVSMAIVFDIESCGQ